MQRAELDTYLDQYLDVAKFRACLDDRATVDRIEKDGEAFREAHGHGLPTLFIDAIRLEGAQEREALEQALDTAIRATGS